MTPKVYRTLVAWLMLAATGWAQAPGVPNDLASGVQQLEQWLENMPYDRMVRTALLYAYFADSGLRDTAKVIEARRKHILWLVQNAPADPLAGGSAASIDRAGDRLADPEGYRLVSEAWRAQIALPDVSVPVLMNAAFFFKVAETELAAGLLVRALTIEPSNQAVSSMLGMEYALAILGVTMMNKDGIALAADPVLARSPFARKALQSLQLSTDVDVLAAAFVHLSFAANALPGPLKLEVNPEPIAEDLLRRIVTLVTLDPTNQRTMAALARYYRARAGITTDLTEKAALWRQASQQFEAAVTGSQSPDQRFSILVELVRVQMEAGDTKRAEVTAIELLAMAENLKTHWSYGNALNWGNLTLGAIALKADDIAKAKAYLLAAGRTPGSEQLDAFGPNMTLARDLLLKSERAAVIEYLMLCRVFWEMDGGKLNEWIATVEGGGTPDFAENLMH